MSTRDEFDKNTVEAIGKRASYICSNPDCKNLTLCPSAENEDKFIYIGKAAHITAAAEGGPRYDSNLTSEQRKSTNNGIFLCSNCADMIDKNNGIDFSVDQLKQWKKEHEEWATQNLNKSLNSLITTIDGEHTARGKGNVTGIKTTKPTFFKPGTKSTAEGEGNITATYIGS
ncbi:hypothetical protein HYV69_00290 [Candidatus Uhrbacteria bacterium]|nr:hypothetical protein [Candidatus Uhrbacteria bacterium]